MGKIILCFSAALILFCVPAAAQDRSPFDSGNNFIRECAAAWKTECMAFTIGAFQGSQVQRRTICLPQGVDSGQLYEVANAYIRNHPERAHEMTVALLLESWESAFPCK